MKHQDPFEFSITEVAEPSPSGVPSHVPLETNDGDGVLLRDTLAFHIGLVGCELLDQTFADAGTVSRYFAWLDDVAESDDDDCAESRHELARAGLGPEGSLELVARSRVDEFLGYLNHPEFSAVLSLAYSVSEREIIGIHLVGFNGKPMLATRWLQGLRRALARQAAGRNVPAFIN